MNLHRASDCIYHLQEVLKFFLVVLFCFVCIVCYVLFVLGTLELHLPNESDGEF